MPHLDWSLFDSLPGSKSQNFENLCRALMRLHFGRYGNFIALKNQPGVEFHLKLTQACKELGDPPRWYGWQCKLHQRNLSGDLNAASRSDISDSLAKAEKYLPELTDWVLWTPYTLSKGDQTWFRSLPTKFTLHLWAEEDVDTCLSGPGLMLRSTYFGELVLTPQELDLRHRESIQPVKERWLETVHQSVDAERIIRRMVGEPGSWGQMILVGQRLRTAAQELTLPPDLPQPSMDKIQKAIAPFVSACAFFADTLLNFHDILAEGDLDIIQQKLGERKTLIDTAVVAAPRLLRAWNLPAALAATNAVDDMRVAVRLLDEVEEFLGVGLVAVLADAGGGKTQMAAQLTARQAGRPAGILLHGRDLHKGHGLDDLARHYAINGNPVSSMERLLSALDAAGKRSRCRLPLIIDGLNEAENPKDWKAPLAILNETIRRYPNVLVVCTLRTGEHRRDEQMRLPQPQSNVRESFAVMALPDGLRTLESEGFGGDVREAIKKYFSYYKISAENSEIPVEFLQHPLTLRIFCEVTNPKKEQEVKVDYFPASLSPLFAKYVANVCERISQMVNLSHSYTFADVEAAIYKLGLDLWDSRRRHIREASYRLSISDNTRPWNSSIVNLLTQEGIIFRNPGDEPGEFVLTPVYDALGGYIIANSLLSKFARDFTFEWLKNKEVIELFVGENSHALSLDIFYSLVSLVPLRMSGRQLWKDAPDALRTAALRFTSGLEGRFLDKDTVTALFDLLKSKPKERSRLFSRLQNLRAALDHPLNAEFLYTTLRSLSIVERDLSWTEWIRANRAERFNDLLAIELRWKNDIVTRSSADRLRAKWVIWLLTSTDHQLRDISTRALYWFGRGDPSALFEECIDALSINDSYVPERLLSAGYGVAMALHVDLKDQAFLKTLLPRYSRQLYDAMFAKNAPYSTTHLLFREYAARTIELTIMHHPGLFSAVEIARTKPPYDNNSGRKWGESKNTREELHGSDSPFRMDFENYTIGSLVPGRSNYDFKHAEYRKVRSQILWRVEQIGWSSELFKQADSSIASDRHYPRVGSDGNKVDRYGKKYSWIAYFEMSGYLLDQGLLKKWRERTSDVDIDPSFPERVPKGNLIQSDYLGDAGLKMADWIASGPLPDVDPYLYMTRVNNEDGPWIALDGYFSQQDEKRGRKLFCFIRTFLVEKHEASPIMQHLTQQDFSERWLPEKPSVIYTYCGEIPWCETYPANGWSELSFATKIETIKVQRTQEEFYLDGEKLAWSHIDMIRRRLFGDIPEDDKHKDINDQDLTRIEVRSVPIEVDEEKRHYAQYKALIPVCNFGWESYHTTASDAGHAITLAKEIATESALIGQPQSFELFTRDGIKATLNIADRGDEIDNRESMFFIRESILRAYLEKKNLTLIWAIWGEREYSNKQIEKLFHGPDHPEQPYAVFGFAKCLEELR